MITIDTLLGTPLNHKHSQNDVIGLSTSLDGKVDITGDSMTGDLTITKTTRQLRLAYDGSNYVDFTVNSAGRLLLNATSDIVIMDDGELQITKTAANSGAFKTFQAGNPAQSFEFSSSGNMNWGDGSTSPDTAIFRKGPALLQVERNLWLGNFGTEDIRLGFDYGTIFNLQSKDMDFLIKSSSYDAFFVDASNNSVAVMNNSAGKVGFYGTAPITRQTGVAVTAAGIHAALVNLGLITA